MVHPILIDAVTITDQDTLPILNQGGKGLLGTIGVNEVERHRIGAQSPEPVQSILAVPGRLIDIAHRGLTGQGGNGLIVGPDGLRDAVNDFLNCT